MREGEHPDHALVRPVTRIRRLQRREEILSQTRGDAEFGNTNVFFFPLISASPRLCESFSSDGSSRSHAYRDPTSGAGKRIPGLRVRPERLGEVSHFPRTAVGLRRNDNVFCLAKLKAHGFSQFFAPIVVSAIFPRTEVQPGGHPRTVNTWTQCRAGKRGYPSTERVHL